MILITIMSQRRVLGRDAAMARPCRNGLRKVGELLGCCIGIYWSSAGGFLGRLVCASRLLYLSLLLLMRAGATRDEGRLCKLAGSGTAVKLGQAIR